MHTNDIYDLYSNEINNMENNMKDNTNKIKIIIILLNNDVIDTIVKKDFLIKNSKLTEIDIKEILNNINSEICKNQYKITYLLKFSIKADIESLENLDYYEITNSENLYELDIIKNIDAININYDDNFNITNSLIVILNKIDKPYFIKKKREKKNKTKKSFR